MSVARCPHCGTANRAGANFCNGCGTDLRERDVRRTPPRELAPRDERPAEESPPAITPPAAPLPPADPSPITSAADPQEPWLHLEFGDDEAAQAARPGEGPPAPLIPPIQGLLAPIRVATNIQDDDPLQPTAAPPATSGLGPDQARLLRSLMSDAPEVAAYTPHPQPRPPRALATPWLFILLALMVGIPALLRLESPRTRPAHLPGVLEAHAAIQGLAANTPVIIYWAYDPAHAGELDLAMQPVMRHLLQRRTRPAVISPLPGGPATAQRLVARVRSAPRPADLALAVDLAQPVTYTYMPGGAAVLPLVVRSPQLVGAPESPGLVVVAAAQADDVQAWLEQVQPQQRVPVVAVTAAGADPILRPYLDSGQLVGLVSGFDGGHAYQETIDPFVMADQPPVMNRQLALQNWGQAALLAAILLGNLAALLSRSPGA